MGCRTAIDPTKLDLDTEGPRNFNYSTWLSSPYFSAFNVQLCSHISFQIDNDQIRKNISDIKSKTQRMIIRKYVFSRQANLHNDLFPCRFGSYPMIGRDPCRQNRFGNICWVSRSLSRPELVIWVEIWRPAHGRWPILVSFSCSLIHTARSARFSKS